jgi:hypothetical protein
MMTLNINTTSTTNQFKAFGQTVNVPYRVTLRDYTLANETRNGNYGKDKSGNNIYNENLYDLMGVVKNGKLVLSSRWQSEIGNQDGYDLNDTTAIEAAIKSWEDIVTKRGRIFAKDGSSKITRKSLVADSPPVDSPKEKTSDEDTVNRFSEFACRFLDPKAPKLTTTFMGKTLIAGSTEPTYVVTFPGNPAYNISVTYDPETGYTVKSQKGGITENGKVFKKAEDAERAIKKYKTRIEQYLAEKDKKKPKPDPYAEAWKNLDFSEGVNVFDPNFKIEGLGKYEGLGQYKFPDTNDTGPLF